VTKTALSKVYDECGMFRVVAQFNCSTVQLAHEKSFKGRYRCGIGVAKFWKYFPFAHHIFVLEDEVRQDYRIYKIKSMSVLKIL
jgi:hypothetical protein